MTVGQGDAIWERFSHNAILIRDRETGWEAAFNWGIFDFDQVDFVPRLIRGTMLYRMEPWDPGAYVEQTRLESRRMWLQELALTPEQRWALLTFVEWNARPENQYYRYDYYRDNCSTRVRDALDRVLGGRIRQVAAADSTPRTYRWHTRRLLQDTPWAYLGIQTVLGPRADRPLTVWEETFLPQRLMELLRRVEVPGEDGSLRPLVVEERLLLESTRPFPPAAPPFAFPWFLLAGFLWGGSILALAGGGAPRGIFGRLTLSLLAGGWSVLASLAGGLLLSAWLFTDHLFWHGNLNLLQLNPLAFPLAGAFAMLLLRGSFPRWGRDLALVLGALAAIGAVLSVLPFVGQENGEILGLTVPLGGAVALAGVRLHGLSRGAGGAGSEESGASGAG
jgi:hypothetical protein